MRQPALEPPAPRTVYYETDEVFHSALARLHDVQRNKTINTSFVTHADTVTESIPVVCKLCYVRVEYDGSVATDIATERTQARSQAGVGPVGRPPPPKCGQVRFLRSTFLSVSEWFH